MHVATVTADTVVQTTAPTGHVALRTATGSSSASALWRRVWGSGALALRAGPGQSQSVDGTNAHAREVHAPNTISKMGLRRTGGDRSALPKVRASVSCARGKPKRTVRHAK